ncbi:MULTISPECIES: hypothetical protein [Tsukamurella]|uniref:Uncharacterized protein n=2 Tax=Tsukamurella TaxID=2060 RepID=A0A5C5RW96_9ACTN|nr:MULTISPECIES: hypothetical protein [Tsukamurella]NMD55635.1 hypothetical protein [Tsukamurella columbiensis]TWS26952.1 hypothetical protein FK530_21330 [Tsukamurella conjunctivitidis]
MTRSDDGDDFVDSLVLRDMTEGSADFNAQDIAFLRRNPQILDKLADPLEVKRRFLYILFGVAVSMAVISKLVEYTGVLEDHPVPHDLLTNVLFSISIELLGAATVAFLLELVFEKRIRRNQDLVRTLLRQSPKGEQHRDT